MVQSWVRTNRVRPRPLKSLGEQQRPHITRSQPLLRLPKSSRCLTKQFQVMLYTALGNVSLPESLEAVHLLGALAGHDLDCGSVVDDFEVSGLDEDVDD